MIWEFFPRMFRNRLIKISFWLPSPLCLTTRWGGVGHNREKYCIGLFHVSGNLEQFGGLFFGGQINYFGGMG